MQSKAKWLEVTAEGLTVMNLLALYRWIMSCGAAVAPSGLDVFSLESALGWQGTGFEADL